jgi:hypothetical protein
MSKRDRPGLGFGKSKKPKRSSENVAGKMLKAASKTPNKKGRPVKAWGTPETRPSLAIGLARPVSNAVALIREAAPPPPVEQLMLWLSLIFEFWLSLDSKDKRQLFWRYFRKCKLKKRGRPLLRCVIELGAKPHSTQKSRRRYEQLLTSAKTENVVPRDLAKFVAANGGINKCAKRMAKRSARARQNATEW